MSHNPIKNADDLRALVIALGDKIYDLNVPVSDAVLAELSERELRVALDVTMPDYVQAVLSAEAAATDYETGETDETEVFVTVPLRPGSVGNVEHVDIARWHMVDDDVIGVALVLLGEGMSTTWPTADEDADAVRLAMRRLPSPERRKGG